MANGRTIRYMSPVSVFFVLNLVYFLFPIVQLFNASLLTQMQAPLGFLLKGAIARKMADMHMNLESFQLVYNLKTISIAKLLVMVFVVLASLPLNFLYRKRNRFFIDHFGYAVELASFNLFINAIAVDVVTSIIPIGGYIGEGVVIVHCHQLVLPDPVVLHFLQRAWLETGGEVGHHDLLSEGGTRDL